MLNLNTDQKTQWTLYYVHVASISQDVLLLYELP